MLRSNLTMRSEYGPTNKARGFSLMELAVVLMIIGTLMSGVLIAVSRSTANARITNTTAQLREIEEALYGFAQAHGRLPCPASAISNGVEAPVGGGTCSEWHGFVPVATLGIYGPTNEDGLLLDAWLNPIRYSVAQYQYSTLRSFTSEAGLDELFATSAALVAPTGFPDDPDMLHICNTAMCDEIVYSDSAPAVLLSMGANWAEYDSLNEEQNAGNGSVTLMGNSASYNITTSNTFVSAPYSEENFDDQLVWLSPFVLFNRLVNAEKLP